jgi:hypothetical protein
MTWNNPPNEFIIVVRDDIAKRRTDAALVALRDLMFRTPVDTGRARGGWTVGIGRLQHKDRGPNSATQATVEGLAEIASARREAFATVYISNNIPYIRYLNDGTRNMRPLRFMEIVFNDIRVRFG